MLTWTVTETASSLCDVELFLIFVQKDSSSRSVVIPVSNGVYQQCSLTLNAVRVIYKTLGYVWIGSKRVRTSNVEPRLFETSLKATTTETTTTTTKLTTKITTTTTTKTTTTKTTPAITSESDTKSTIFVVAIYSVLIEHYDVTN